MSALFASGTAIDLILALTLVEAIGLTLYHRRTGRGVAPRDFLANLLSGMALLAAVRSALTGADWTAIAACLAAALAAHITDLGRRWHA